MAAAMPPVPLREGEEWKKERYECITGTDVSKLMGLNDQVSKARMIMSKVFYEDDMLNVGEIGQRLMKYGRDYEDMAIMRYVEWLKPTNLSFMKGSLTRKGPFGGTPDVITCAPDTGNLIIGEIKCHSYPDETTAMPYKRIGQIPLKYYLQLQTYLWIFSLQYGYLFSWTLMNGYRAFYVKLDKLLMEEIEERAGDLSLEIIMLREVTKKKGRPEVEEWIKKKFRLKPGEGIANKEKVMKSMLENTVAATFNPGDDNMDDLFSRDKS
jgi:predicted phage-related endonuclease